MFAIIIVLLWVGNGPYLTLHSTTDGSVLDSKCLLPKSRIHGIKGGDSGLV